jgi:hypothetical protein
MGLEAPGGSGSNLTSSGFSISYDALFNRYLMDFPSTTSGYFYAHGENSPNAYYWGGTLATLERTGAHEDVYVLKSSNPSIQLTYTTLLGYNQFAGGSGPFGFAAFGTATPQGSVPVTGSATYNAFVHGGTIDGNAGVEGSATLAFNFGAGTLAGHLDPSLVPYGGMGESFSLGRYDFTNTVYSTGSATFSGQLSNPNTTGTGSFNGMFTGPNAQELMSSWSAPFTLNGQTSQMFGVWVGKKP